LRTFLLRCVKREFHIACRVRTSVGTILRVDINKVVSCALCQCMLVMTEKFSSAPHAVRLKAVTVTLACDTIKYR
jgi:hypothetical protein